MFLTILLILSILLIGLAIKTIFLYCNDYGVEVPRKTQVKNDLKQEEKVLNLLVECWNEFNKLQTQHPDEQRDFCDGIHKCQDIIGVRVARQYRPDLFPVKRKEKYEYRKQMLHKNNE